MYIYQLEWRRVLEPDENMASTRTVAGTWRQEFRLRVRLCHRRIESGSPPPDLGSVARTEPVMT